MSPARRLPNGGTTKDLQVYLAMWDEFIMKVEYFFPGYKVFAYDSDMSLRHPDCTHTLSLSMHAARVLIGGEK